MLLNDRDIFYYARRGMIDPLQPGLVRECDGVKCISYGLSSFGYDMRLGTQFKMVSSGATVLNPKATNEKQWIAFETDKPFTLQPNQSVLGVSLETWHLPDDIFALVTGKSTYARHFVDVLMTPMEPGWKGQLVLEICNHAAAPVLLYPNEGIAQAVFFRGERPTLTYSDRQGKYQNQSGVTLGKV